MKNHYADLLPRTEPNRAESTEPNYTELNRTEPNYTKLDRT